MKYQQTAEVGYVSHNMMMSQHHNQDVQWVGFASSTVLAISLPRGGDSCTDDDKEQLSELVHSSKIKNKPTLN